MRGVLERLNGTASKDVTVRNTSNRPTHRGTDLQLHDWGGELCETMVGMVGRLRGFFGVTPRRREGTGLARMQGNGSTVEWSYG